MMNLDNNYAIWNILYFIIQRKSKWGVWGNLKSLAQQNLKGDVKFFLQKYTTNYDKNQYDNIEFRILTKEKLTLIYLLYFPMILNIKDNVNCEGYSFPHVFK